MAKLKRKRKTWTQADVDAGLVTADGKILKPEDPRTDGPAIPAAQERANAIDKGEIRPGADQLKNINQARCLTGAGQIIGARTMKTIYFYSNKKDSDRNGERFTVYKVKLNDNNIDRAEKKAHIIANRLKDKLAGGYFSGSCKPYNFKKSYTVIEVPGNTKISNKRELTPYLAAAIAEGFCEGEGASENEQKEAWQYLFNSTPKISFADQPATNTAHRSFKFLLVCIRLPLTISPAAPK